MTDLTMAESTHEASVSSEKMLENAIQTWLHSSIMLFESQREKFLIDMIESTTQVLEDYLKMSETKLKTINDLAQQCVVCNNLFLEYYEKSKTNTRITQST